MDTDPVYLDRFFEQIRNPFCPKPLQLWMSGCNEVEFLSATAICNLYGDVAMTLKCNRYFIMLQTFECITKEFT